MTVFKDSQYVTAIFSQHSKFNTIKNLYKLDIASMENENKIEMPEVRSISTQTSVEIPNNKWPFVS